MLTCSRLPLVCHCPAAQLAPAVRSEGDDTDARRGTAVHRLLARAVAAAADEPGRQALLAECADDEVAALVWAGLDCWEQVRAYFPEPEVEQALAWSDGGWTLGGHPDLFSLVENGQGLEVRCLDWKSGWREDDHEQQLRGYCYLIAEAFQADTARACVVRLRDRSAEWLPPWTRAELRAWAADLRDRLVDPLVYRPGRWCAYCPRFLECPAGNGQLTRFSYDLFGLAEAPADWEGATPDRLAVMVEMSRMVERRLDLVRELIRARVRAAGGRLPLSDGRELALLPQQRREINYQAGAEILREALATDLDGLLRVSKTELEAAVRARAPHGRRGAAVTELLAQLEHAGAVHTTLIERLEIRSRTHPETNHHDSPQPLLREVGASAGTSEPPGAA